MKCRDKTKEETTETTYEHNYEHLNGEHTFSHQVKYVTLTKIVETDFKNILQASFSRNRKTFIIRLNFLNIYGAQKISLSVKKYVLLPGINVCES